ncbi:DUF4839 domain-containing protein [Microbacterium sp. GCS4]|uniref:DUF4839 domain-containing protein n=1 Tax=Microbacterium sp. GCS4 TaxID=1692239 RepID=UPI0006A44D91|nr:DUF4839 domain-containing protein [Microbacterium sp. GCS4]KNY05169.1 hypothetical protein AKH00_12345 [Microbacterium sp. GCS4]
MTAELPPDTHAETPVKYETMNVRAIRGLEARTRTKWEADGWEFVSQEQGTLRTELTFRRPKRPVPWKPLAVIGGVLVVAAIIIVVNVALAAGRDAAEPAASDAPSEVAAAEPEPTDEAEETPEPSAAPESVVLTAANNADLAALLTGPQDGPTVEAFASKYAGQTIEFDGSIGAMNTHEGYSTRYDILVPVGDYSETQSSGGPNFQFRDVNITSDLNLIGDVPNTIGVGTNLHIVARVGAYEPNSTLFLLEPVTTQVR